MPAMISRIEGRLVAVDGGRAHVVCGGLTYEVLVPAADQQRLAAAIGETVSFDTLHYLEGQGQGSSFIPRLIGFASEADRAFFELFTSVQRMGNRKALRALALPFSAIAEAIAAEDVDVLKSLPEVGKRTAQTIVSELRDKVDRFVELKPGPGGAPASAPDAATAALVQDAVAVLTQLGEPKLQARQLVERALAADPEIDTAEDLVAAAYRLKELV
ncbi:MAG: Holliday junction branch migration protein RuvA [Planctomycetota bacterium]|nr:Holliday junction branch migration protein RuvA [Planctomycetota bacterium]